MGWHREPLIGFDLETTGTDPLSHPPAECRVPARAGAGGR